MCRNTVPPPPPPPPPPACDLRDFSTLVALRKKKCRSFAEASSRISDVNTLLRVIYAVADLGGGGGHTRSVPRLLKPKKKKTATTT